MLIFCNHVSVVAVDLKISRLKRKATQSATVAMDASQTNNVVMDTAQMRLYNPKPKSYKNNIKNNNQRLEKLEKVFQFALVL